MERSINRSTENAAFAESELEKRLYRLKTLFDASQEVVGLRDARDILDNLLLNAIGGFGAAKGFVFLADSPAGGIETILHRGFDEDPGPRLDGLLSAGKFNGFFDTGSPPDPSLLSSIGVFLLKPLTVSEEVKGAIGLGERITGEPYTDEDMELLGTLVAHGESRVRNVRLLHQLEKRVFHLRTLYDLSQEIAFLKEPREILRALLMTVMGTFGVVSGVSVLADVEKGKIEVLEWRGMGKDSISGEGTVFERDYFEGLKDISRPIVPGSGVNPSRDGEGEAVRLLASVGLNVWIPFGVSERLGGGIGLGEKLSGEQYSADDVELLATLAAQGAVAVENAKLLERMKREEVARVNFSRYLSPQIVEKIVHHDVEVNLGGDRKVVTILFSDIRNFTTITENRPPDQLVHILNEYFTEMAQIIFAHQGSLDKYIGDAIVAVFGSLVPVENPAKNAVAAAVAMMRRLPELNRHWETRYAFYMNIGIGVNTGEVFLGNIGSPERMEFTVIGDAVNVASRFSGLARPGQVLVTKETLNHLGTDFRVREHPPAAMKGKSGKLEVFEITYRQSVV
ncbi:MAG: adenylate/guanylate cyclase with sensor and domain protein [Deltaproteobacteria bacterium]|nr:adenylate/guanylate cyclase with sensor and domain protein [Deltaproteobacteria bacterium]